MGIWSKLFGSSDIVNAGISAADKMFYTDEEKAEGKRLLLKAYEPFKIAQRLLALTFCIPYALSWFITFIASFFIDTSKQFEYLTNPVGIAGICTVIVTFYFVGGTIESAKR